MISTRMPGFYDELSKIANELAGGGERKDFAQPNKEEEGHKGKYPIPDKKHYGIALGFAKMHHDPKALSAIHAKGKEMGYAKEAGLLKDVVNGRRAKGLGHFLDGLHAGSPMGQAGSAARDIKAKRTAHGIGRLAGAGVFGAGLYAAGRNHERKKHQVKESEGFGGPNITDGDEMGKMAGFLKNTIMGVGMLGATAGGAHAVKSLAKPAAQIAKAPRMVGAASSQMADLAREGVKFASRRSF